ncbi:MAG TPA: major tail protein [Candidatus Blautia avistercoris]|nr:major tail protein [Candidatus Blautia avistercoris]
MAYIGLTKPTVAKLDESGGTPEYTDGFACGKAIEMSITPNYAEGSLYADNEKAEYDKEFSYAEVTLNTSTLPIEAHKIMFGHTTDEEENTIVDKSADESNYVGLGIYVREKVNGVRKYIAMWIHKVKFTESEESYKTKGDAIEYQTPSITGQAIAISTGEWRERKICDTEQEAKDWIDEQAGLKESA